MADDFKYDVFLSHSAKDKAVVRPIAERLREDGLRVWLDDWEIRPGDSISAKIEEGLEHSRVLVLCMSANVFGSDWAQLEAGTFRFRDPLNTECRFVSLRLDETLSKVRSPVIGRFAEISTQVPTKIRLTKGGLWDTMPLQPKTFTNMFSELVVSLRAIFVMASDGVFCL